MTAIAASAGETDNTGTADNFTVLSYNGVEVEMQDLAQYIAARILPEAYESALSKPGAVFQSIGNLYIIRRAAQLAELEGLTDDAALAYIAQDAANREAVDLYVADKTDQRLKNADWDALAREQFIVDRDKYAGGEEVAVSHILIKSEGRAFKDLVSRVDEVANALNGDTPFHELAFELSEDPSAKRNRGSLGFVARGAMAPEFEAAAFALTEEGEVSEPVLTRFGVHFIKYGGRRMGAGPQFESVKPAIVKRLKKSRTTQSRNLILEPLRKDISDELGQLDEERLARQLYDMLTGSQQ